MSPAFSGNEYCVAFHAGITSAQKMRVLDLLNPSKQEIHLDDIEKFISYITENTVRLHCKDQLVSSL